MQSLAVKYRPTKLSEVVGQTEIKQILQNQLDTKTFRNVYLFTGRAGTGKTTTGRIFANEINNHKGVLIEIDGASNNGVDTIRELIDSAYKKSLDSEYKVYLLDEVHAFTTNSWNAMLKLIEEPPAQTIFIMCTTDPQKIPSTILSRVQRFDFKRIPTNLVKERLKYIVNTENLVVADDVLDYIARITNGGMRDAITSLDKCLASPNELTVDVVSSLLGNSNEQEYFDLLDTFEFKSLSKMLNIFDVAYDNGRDLRQFLIGFQGFLIDVLKYLVNDSLEYTGLTASEKLRDLKDIDPSIPFDALGVVNELIIETKNVPNNKYIIEGRLILWVKNK